jgi:rare lipoprotein A
MIALNGATPSASGSASSIPFPGQLTNSAATVETPTVTASASGFAQLPEFGPIVTERPDIASQPPVPFSLASLSYADERVQRAWGAFAALDETGSSAWKQATSADGSKGASSYIAVGTYASAVEAKAMASTLTGFGKSEIQQSNRDGKPWYSVNLYPDGHGNLDDLLQAAWSRGAPDALAVRD